MSGSSSQQRHTASRRRWRSLAVGLFATAALLATTGCGQPQPVVAAQPPPPTTTSQADADLLAAYLAAIEANGGGVAAVAPARLLATGQLVCDRLDEGATQQQVVNAVRAEREGYTEDEAGTLIVAATEVLCPRHAAAPGPSPRPTTLTQRQPAPDPNDETDAGVTDPCLGPDSDPVACSDGYSDDADMPSSGESQFEYGCEQGYIPPEDCD